MNISMTNNGNLTSHQATWTISKHDIYGWHLLPPLILLLSIYGRFLVFPSLSRTIDLVDYNLFLPKCEYRVQHQSIDLDISNDSSWITMWCRYTPNKHTIKSLCTYDKAASHFIAISYCTGLWYNWIESIYSLQNVEASRLNSCNCFIHFIRTTWLLEHSIHVRGYWGLAAGHTLILPPPTFYR